MNNYLSSIIQNVSDAIIVYDHQSGIKIFNHAAETLFKKNKTQVIGKSLSQILNQTLCDELLKSDVVIKQIEYKIQKQTKKILVSKTVFTDQDKKENTILVFRDLTEFKRLEEQIKYKEHHSAIAHLASGVAHEIRNPLNTISTIIQQIGKDFEPKKNSVEFHQLTNLVFKEVQRINKTVQGFLNFALSDPIKPRLFQLSDLFNIIFRQYKSLLADSNLEFTLDQSWDGEVYWDYQQIQQVFMNLIQNAIDVLNPNGKIVMTVIDVDEKELEILVYDTGPGIPTKMRSKIFNLYYTTKAKGTGIGLSIVRRIVYEHGGTISVKSSEDKGTTFILRMPKRIEV